MSTAAPASPASTDAKPTSRWARPAGYREVLVMAVPLIISTAGISIQFVVDRIFLSWYNPSALAAAMPGSIVSFTAMSLFIGVAGYVSAFVAQYHGAGRPERIGPALWQGMWVAVVAAILHVPLYFLAKPFFIWVGHEPAVAGFEADYFRHLCWRAGPSVACAALGGYFGGLGRTQPVMWVTVTGTLINIGLDYPMINGLVVNGVRWLPEMGIVGAAWATNISQFATLAMFMLLLLRREDRVTRRAWSGWRIEPDLFRRLLYFGLPIGGQRMLEVSCFTAFLLLVGRLGTVELAASSIAFDINSLVFMPLFGLGTAVAVLVGQHLGADRPDLAERAAWSSLQMGFGYVIICALSYSLLPWVFLAPFEPAPGSGTFETFPQISAHVVILLKFVALYALFDAFSIIFMSTLGGAGDSRFLMYAMVGLSFTLMVVPSYLAFAFIFLAVPSYISYHVQPAAIYVMWVFLTTYVIVLSLVLTWRFREGKWKSMRVIEAAPPGLAIAVQQGPVPMQPDSPAPGLLSAPSLAEIMGSAGDGDGVLDTTAADDDTDAAASDDAKS